MLKKIPKQWKPNQVNNILKRTIKETKYPWSCWGRAEGQNSFAVVAVYTIYIRSYECSDPGMIFK